MVSTNRELAEKSGAFSMIRGNPRTRGSHVDTNVDHTHKDDRLLRRLNRLAVVYSVALLILIVTIGVSYLILRSAFATQQHLSDLDTHVHSLSLELVDSISVMRDARERMQYENANPRILDLIKGRISTTIASIDHISDLVWDTAERLEGSRVWDDIRWIVDNTDDGLHFQLGSYLSQMQLMAERDDSAAINRNRPPIPADAAAARNGNLWEGYQRASEQLSDLIELQSQRVNAIHYRLSQLVVVSMLLFSLLVVSPLWHGLVREHRGLRAARDQLREQAHVDSETGLLNIFGLGAELRSTAAADVEQGDTGLVLVKIANLDDLYNLVGSHQSESLHSLFAGRLKALALHLQPWARSGESEYVALFHRSTIEGAPLWSAHFYAALTEPLSLDGVMVTPVLRIGVSRISATGAVGTALLLEHQKRARMASQYFSLESHELAVYSPEFTNALMAQNTLRMQVAEGVKRREFVPYYQAKIDAKTGKPSSLEALCRWRHANGQISGPDQFIPTAEQSGQVVPLTYLMLDQIVDDIRSWTARGLSVGRVSVNFSGGVLAQPDVLERLADVAQRLPRNCAGLEIEVTENVALGEAYEQICSTLSAIRGMGIHVSIDDFGTGFASLKTLTDLPYDTLKIDKTFVDQMCEDGTGSELVSAIVSLASKLDRCCVVEGVETEWQWRQLASLGADELQGFYFHRPVPADALYDWLSLDDSDSRVA